MEHNCERAGEVGSRQDVVPVRRVATPISGGTKAWHYTTGEMFQLIKAEGLLRPATEFVEASERPINWFSTNQYWEPSATKGIIEWGVRRNATLEEMRVRGRGLVRLGIDERRLSPWRKIANKAGMSVKTKNDLIVAGKKMDADHKQWFGTLEILPLRDLAVEVMDESGAWQSVPSPVEELISG